MLDARRWWKLTGDEAAHQVVSICDALASTIGAQLKERWFTARSLYESRKVEDESMMTVAIEWNVELYNVSRSAADTAQAEIAARQRPKPMFMTTGANWRTKRKAKKLDRFVEAHFHQTQGARYADVWELGEDVFRDASIGPIGWIKVAVDVQQERIRYERVPAYEILVDPLEARDGDPKNWFHVYDMDLDAALEQFAGDDVDSEKREKVRTALESSAGFGRASAGIDSMSRVAQTVKVREAWRLPISSTKPGKHIFATDNGCLHEEDWKWPGPPLASIIWSREAFGINGVGLVESGAAQHTKINVMADKLHERLTLCASKRTYYQPGTVSEEQLKSNDAEVLIPLNDISKMPREVNTPPVTSAEADLLETEIRRYYDFQGVSQMSAAQRKEPGVESGTAISTLGDMKAVRFLPKSRAYELLFARLGELTVRAARDLAIAKPGLVAKWPGKKFLQEIPWKEVDLPEDMYEVRVAPVSAMSRDPAQRLQIVENLAKIGFLPKEKYFELIGMPDLDSYLAHETSESQWVERLVERYLDAEDDAELAKLGGFVEPDGYALNPMGALVIVAQHYFDALSEEVPRFNADLLRRYMTSLRKLIEKREAAMAPPPAPAVVPPAPGALPVQPQPMAA